MKENDENEVLDIDFGNIVNAPRQSGRRLCFITGFLIGGVTILTIAIIVNYLIWQR